jgi:hypothetical protein
MRGDGLRRERATRLRRDVRREARSPARSLLTVVAMRRRPRLVPLASSLASFAALASFASLVPLWIGCSSADLQVSDPQGDSGGDTRVDETTPAEGGADVGGDAPPADSTAGDTGPIEGGTGEVGTDSALEGGTGDAILADTSGCTTLPANATSLYVDNHSTRPSVGTIDCPYRTILEATVPAWSGPPVRTIFVRGGPAGGTPYDYAESAAIVVRANVILRGEGPQTTRITRGATCPSGGTCNVEVQAGGTLDGFTVMAGGGSAIITNGTSAAIATVRNTIATGASGDGNYGVLVYNATDLGPNIQVINNGRGGVMTYGSTRLRVAYGTGVINRFDGNGAFGISVEGSAPLLFEGGSASANATSGIRITPVVGTLNAVSNLTANENRGVGLTANTFASVVLRNSTFQRNPVGIQFPFGTANTLDLGRDGPGNNNFGGATSTNQNTYAAMCFTQPRTTIPANGNRWTLCPVTPASLTACDLVGSLRYQDVFYVPSPSPVSASVIDASGCSVGP